MEPIPIDGESIFNIDKEKHLACEYEHESEEDSSSAEAASGFTVTEGVQEAEVDGVGERRGLLAEEESISSSKGCSEAMTNDFLISEEVLTVYKSMFN